MSSSKSIQHSFEVENEERRAREQIKQNIIKRYAANCAEEVFYVGTPEMQDPYSGESIYEEVERKVEDEEILSTDSQEFAADEANANDGESDIESEEERLKKEEEARLAEEIYQRLMAEAAADEKAKQDEIAALLMEQEASSDDYNEATGSYSGLYGKKPMSDDEAAALASIMDTNSSFSKSIEDLIQENQDNN